MDISLKIWRTVPIIIFYDVGLFQGNRFGLCWAHFMRDMRGFGYWLFFLSYNGWCRLTATLEKIPESFSIATICESLMLENGVWGAGFCRAWAILCAAMMTISEEEF